MGSTSDFASRLKKNIFSVIGLPFLICLSKVHDNCPFGDGSKLNSSENPLLWASMRTSSCPLPSRSHRAIELISISKSGFFFVSDL